MLDDVVPTGTAGTPYPEMLQTGRLPQTTGHIIKSTRTHRSEVGIADAFARQS